MSKFTVVFFLSTCVWVFADDECKNITVKQPLSKNFVGQMVYLDIVRQGQSLQCRLRVKVSFENGTSHYSAQYDNGATEIWYARGPVDNVFTYYYDAGLRQFKKRVVVVYVDPENPVDPAYYVDQTCGADGLDWFGFRYEPLNEICDRRNSFNATGGIIEQIGNQFGGSKKLLKAIDNCIFKHTKLNCRR